MITVVSKKFILIKKTIEDRPAN